MDTVRNTIAELWSYIKRIYISIQCHNVVKAVCWNTCPPKFVARIDYPIGLINNIELGKYLLTIQEMCQ